MSLMHKIVLAIWVTALVLGAWLLVAASGVKAHETAAAEGIPEYVYLSGCCSKNDCKMIKFEAIRFTEKGYEFELEGSDQTFTVKEEESQDSPDGRFWACMIMPTYCAHWGPEMQYDGPMGGSKYRKCLEYKTKAGEWSVRSRGDKKCFWKPVNA